MQSENTDQKHGSGCFRGKPGKGIAQVAVETGRDAVTAKGARHSRPVAGQVFGAQRPVPACAGTFPAPRALRIHRHFPWRDSSPDVCKKADGADGRAVDHGSLSAGQGHHDQHAQNAEQNRDAQNSRKSPRNGSMRIRFMA